MTGRVCKRTAPFPLREGGGVALPPAGGRPECGALACPGRDGEDWEPARAVIGGSNAAAA